MPTTSVRRVIPAPIHDIWHAISDIPNAKRWNPGWERIEFTTNQTHGAGTRFRAHVDSETAFDFEITDWVVPEFISFTPIREPGERYAIMLESQAFRLSEVDDEATGVEVISRASTHGIRGVVVGLFFWSGHQKQGLERALDNLESLFLSAEAEDSEEAGEDTGVQEKEA